LTASQISMIVFICFFSILGLILLVRRSLEIIRNTELERRRVLFNEYSGSNQESIHQLSNQPSRMNDSAHENLNIEKNNVLTEEMMNQLPLVKFGATDVKAVIGKYNRTFKMKADSYTSKEEEYAYTTNHLRQKAAFSACTSCSICISDFEQGEQVCLLPKCGHAFHKDCIKQWLTEKKQCCPLCQKMVE